MKMSLTKLLNLPGVIVEDSKQKKHTLILNVDSESISQSIWELFTGKQQYIQRLSTLLSHKEVNDPGLKTRSLLAFDLNHSWPDLRTLRKLLRS